MHGPSTLQTKSKTQNFEHIPWHMFEEPSMGTYPITMMKIMMNNDDDDAIDNDVLI